jgi:hypothetical protein
VPPVEKAIPVEETGADAVKRAADGEPLGAGYEGKENGGAGAEGAGESAEEGAGDGYVVLDWAWGLFV